MPDWKVNEPNIDLRLHDEPLAYQSSVARISFQIDYWQRDDRIPAANIFTMGPGWECSWQSYIDTDGTTNDPVLFNGASGGEIQFSDLTGATPNYYYNLRMQSLTDTNGNLTGFDVFYPSGAEDVYGFLVTNISGTVSQAYLSQKIDEHGRTTAFVYAPFDPTTGVVQLNYVIDPDGKTNTLSYTSNASYNYLISQVQDPFGHTVRFAYDANGYLTNVTDVAGLSSSFGYGSFPGSEYSAYIDYLPYGWIVENIYVPTNYWLNQLTTPYGTTSFTFTDDSLSEYDVANRSVVITEPNGSHQMFVHRGFTSFISSIFDTSNVPTSTPDGSTLDDLLMVYRNSFYWGRQQFANLSATFLATGATNWDLTQLTANDYLEARWQKWAHSGDDGQSDALTMEQDPSPDGVTPGEMTWFTYPNPDYGLPYYQGSSAMPALAIKVLPDGSQWYQQYQVDQWGNRTNVISTYTLPDGSVGTRTNSYVYAANGQDLLASIGPDGVTTAAYGYDNAHQVKAMTNALGEVTRNTYSTAYEQLTSITQPNGLVTTNIYGSDRYLAQQIIKGFSTNSYTYTNGLVYSHTDERGLIVTNSWDALQRLTNIAYPDGHLAYTYSNLDLVRVVDRMGFTNSYGYNSIRQKISETDALGHATGYAYCECGALYAITNALQQVTYFIHDNQGNLTQASYPDGYAVYNTYNLLRQLVVKTDNGGMSISNYFNNQGLLIASTNNTGRIQALSYNINDQTTNSVDANGVSVGMTYDNLHRLRTRSYPDGGVEKYGYTFNVSGPTSYTNQIGNLVLYAYDPASRKTNEVYVGVTTNKFAYNGAGDLLTLTDGKNQNTTWKYDQFGRVTNKLDNLGTNLFVYQYDPDNRLTNRWSAAKTNTVYKYDAVGNLTNVVYPVSVQIKLRYDAMNRLTNLVDGAGTTAYGYDAAGQLLNEGGLWLNDTVSYTYTNRLRTGLSVLAPNASAWTQGYGYDSARRLTNVVSPAGGFGYAYDSTRQLQVARLSLPNGAYVTNGYDGNARLLSTVLKNSGNTVLDSEAYAYNQANQRTGVTRTAGDYVNYTYDNMGELKTALGKEAGGVTNRWQEQFGYAYDAAGNLNFRTNNALVQTFNVNSLNELTTITNAGKLTVAGTTTSPATNVTVNTSNAVLYADITFAATNFTIVNGNNTFTAIAKDSYGRRDTNSITVNLPGTNNFAYDLNGNLLSDGKRAFAYDDENQLIRVTVTNGWKSEYTYDGKMRRRMVKEFTWNGSWVQTNEVHFIYDGNLVVQERDANNLPLVTYTRGNDLSGKLQSAGGIGGLLARTDRAQVIPWIVFPGGGNPAYGSHSYYHADGNGNVTMLISASQMIVAKYLYDPYGNTLAQSGLLADINTYRFSSKEWNANSGLYYYLYRFYDSSLQRWLNRDPLGDKSVLEQASKNQNLVNFLNLRNEGFGNLFEFNHDNPEGFVDKDGRQIAIPAGGVIIGGGIIVGVAACAASPWCRQHILHLPPISIPRPIPVCPAPSKPKEPDSTEECHLQPDNDDATGCTYYCEKSGILWEPPSPGGCPDVITIPYKPEQ
jgi:RHS repeat-associated protein